MPTILILAVGAAMGLVLVVLVVVAVGIRQEPRAQVLSRQPPSLMAAVARRLSGAHVRRPGPSVILDEQRGEPELDSAWPGPHAGRPRPIKVG
jgi:hypothetical protein